MFKYKYISLVLSSILFVACGGGGSSSSSSTTLVKPSSKNIVVSSSNIIEQSNFPAEVQAASDIGYSKMIELSFANNSSASTSSFSTKSTSSTPTIRILAVDDGLNGEKLKRAVAVMSSLLSNLDTSENLVGKNKEDVIKTMASRQATLFINSTEASAQEMSVKLYIKSAIDSGIDIDTLITNAKLTTQFDGVNRTDFNAIFNKFQTLKDTKIDPNDETEKEAFQAQLLPAVRSNSKTPLWIRHSQDLYFSEIVLEGSEDYFTNNQRDGSFEEILHIIQAQGIAVTNKTKTLQENIRSHAKDIYDSTQATPPATNPIWNPGKDMWENDWANDDVVPPGESYPEIGPTYSHEYYAVVIESFYGMWGDKKYETNQADKKGKDEYSSITRSEITTKDPIGLGYANEFVPKYHQYTARIQSAGVESYYKKINKVPVFKMHLEENDQEEKYTFKSQYLINAQIVGDAQINLEGNDQNNILEGNSQDNSIDGKDGEDTYVIDGKSSDYTISSDSSFTTVKGSNIGTDLLTNIEYIHFNDKKVKLD